MNIFKKLSVFIVFLFLTNIVCGQYIAFKGNKFLDENGNNFYPMIMNYYVELAYESLPATISNSYIQRQSDVSISGTFCCGGITSGLNNIEQDFNEIKNQGFNTIRLIFKPMKRFDTDGYNLKVEEFPSGQNLKYIIIRPPYIASLNQEFNFYLRNLLAVINLANRNGLKIICPLTEDSVTTLMISYQDDLNDYIAGVSSFMRENNVRNILAYEFIGEPSYAVKKDNPESENRKCDICRISNRWIQTIKTSDPSRLTTIGAVHFNDPSLYGWDPNFINVDFINVHYYPVRYESEYNVNVNQSLENTIKRYLDAFYVYDNFIRKPYVVGETAFTAVNSLSFPETNGTEIEQAYFVDKTLSYLLKRTNSYGYGWWIFNDYVWDPKWGTVRLGSPDSLNIDSGWVQFRKPVVQSLINIKQGLFFDIKNFNYGPSTSTYNINDLYYNPYLKTSNSFEYTDSSGITHYGFVKGFIKDQRGIPIKGAIIDGYNVDGVGHVNVVQAKSDDQGYFELYIDDTRPSDNGNSDPNMDKVFYDLKILAFGAIPIQRETKKIKDVDIYTLYSLNYKLDEVRSENGITVPIGTETDFKAFSRLIVSNANIEGSAIFSARKEVELTDGFDAKPGSEVHILNTSFDVLCDDIEILENLDAKTKSARITNDLESLYLQNKYEVFPNPTKGVFYIKCSNNKEFKDELKISNVSGSIILSEKITKESTIVDISSEKNGIYFISISSNGNLFRQKLIKF